MSQVIRPLMEQDIPDVISLLREMLDESPLREKFTFSADGVVDECWQIMGTPLKFGWVAVDEKGVFGLLFATAYRLFALEDYLADDMAFFIRKDARGGSAAFELVNEYKLWAKRLGIARIYIIPRVGIAADRVQLFLETIGFHHEGNSLGMEV